MFGRTWPISLLLPALLCLAGEARGQSEPVEELLEDAEEAFLDVEYERALDLLYRAEDLQEEASDEQIVRLLALRGTILYLQGDEADARGAFGRLLALDRGYRLPEHFPPRAAEFFDAVRQEVAVAVSVDHRPPRGFRLGDPMEIEATIRGVTSLHTVRIFFRLAGGRGYSSTEMERLEGDRFIGTIPATGSIGEGRGGEVEYFILVVAGDERVANSGSPGDPHAFTYGTGQSRPARPSSASRVLRSWWFWTAVGGAVVLALGLGLGLGLGGDEPETGSVDLTIRFNEGR